MFSPSQLCTLAVPGLPEYVAKLQMVLATLVQLYERVGAWITGYMI